MPLRVHWQGRYEEKIPDALDEQGQKKGGGRVQTMAEQVECMRTRVGFVVRCVRGTQMQL
jgi:hypothetical protein